MLLTPIITVSSTAPVELLAYTGQLFGDTWLLTAIAIGIPLAFYIIKGAIGLVRGRAK